MSYREIDLFLLHLIEERHVSESTQNVAISAIKFFYRHVLHNEVYLQHLRRPKSRMPLPDILSREELRRLFASVDNEKHRTMLMLAYSCGLRVGEVVKIRIRDIDGEEQIAHHLRAGSMRSDVWEQHTFRDQLVAMASDSEIQSELQRIDQEFAPTEADGLERE